jgi:hypothetical protein
MSGITHIHCLRCRCAIELTGDWLAGGALMVVCPTCGSETYLSLSLISPAYALPDPDPLLEYNTRDGAHRPPRATAEPS